MDDYKDVKWEKVSDTSRESRYQGFIHDGEPMVIHVIKSGFEDEYVVVEEYGDLETYEMYIMSALDVLGKYAIEV